MHILRPLTLFALFCLVSGDVLAGVSFRLEAFDASNTQTTDFELGDEVTIRLFAVDETGVNPDFMADNIVFFRSRLRADTSDANEAIGSETINPAFTVATSASSTYQSSTGREFSGSAPAAGVPIPTTSFQLLEFQYTADVLGDTNFFFGSSENETTFVSKADDTAFSQPSPFPLVGTTVTVSPAAAVPEPSTLLALGLIGTGWGVRRYRRGMGHSAS